MAEKHIAAKEVETRHESEQSKEEYDKHAERLRERLEQAERDHHERLSAEDALVEAKELAEKQTKEQAISSVSPAERRRGPLSKKQLGNSFNSQMNHAREHMNPAERTFSRFIHSKPVEVTSDFIGATIARPNALLSGSIFAFLAVTILYFTANHFGFKLSGFESIGAFIIGWILGIIYDYASVAFRNRDH